MPWESFCLTREQVYAAVWAEPMRDAAKQFGISDVALGKICKKLAVPRPWQGYWLRKSVGQDPAKKPLPGPTPGTPTTHEGQRWRSPPPDPSRTATPTRPTPPTDAERIIVHETSGDLHPCVSGGIVKLTAPNRWGLGYRPFIAVSDGSRDRGLRIMNALVRALESRGHRVEVREQSRPGEHYRPAATGAHVGDVFVAFSMFERSRMVQSGPAPKKKANETTAESTRRIFWPKVEYVPRGILTLRVGGWYESQRDWTDEKRSKIEDRLHEVVAAILAHADRIRASRIEQARALEAERERARLRAEAEKRQKAEEEDVAALQKMIADWREVRDVRAFIDEARAIVAAEGLVIREDSKLAGFIRWATARAERIDPLRALREDVREERTAASTAT
ncbi:MAG: hypothetical protein JNL90_10760 [Planctomycetes bacterium]|nr:hypothetical protein [Planctomycetota bacterium]